MTKLRLWAKNFLSRDREEGATMGEYALLLALVSVFLVTAITAFRDEIAAAFNAATTVITNSISGS